ncbi:MAG: hypothetical protein IPN05_04435 [Sulfuritalea sp.]|nr:hypothetical protein [Sulfuritalea sp.]
MGADLALAAQAFIEALDALTLFAQLALALHQADEGAQLGAQDRQVDRLLYEIVPEVQAVDHGLLVIDRRQEDQGRVEVFPRRR